MTITELGALGEFVGAFAVVATLAYLAVQVKQAKLVTAESARATRLQTDTDILLFNASDSIWATGYEKIIAKDGVPENTFIAHLIDQYGFEINEALRMSHWCFAWLKRQEHSFLQPLDSSERTLLDTQVRQWLAQPIGSPFWSYETNRTWFDTRFVAHVDRLLAE